MCSRLSCAGSRLMLLPQRSKLINIFLHSAGKPRGIGVQRLLRLTNRWIEGTARLEATRVPKVLTTDQYCSEAVQDGQPHREQFIDRGEMLVDDRARMRGRRDLRLDLIENFADLADFFGSLRDLRAIEPSVGKLCFVTGQPADRLLDVYECGLGPCQMLSLLFQFDVVAADALTPENHRHRLGRTVRGTRNNLQGFRKCGRVRQNAGNEGAYVRSRPKADIRDSPKGTQSIRLRKKGRGDDGRKPTAQRAE